jgi:hypothetical protein
VAPAPPFSPNLVFNMVHIFCGHPLGDAKVADPRLWRLLLEGLRGVVSARRRQLHPCHLPSCRACFPTQPLPLWLSLCCQAARDLPEEDRATYQLTLERLISICSEEGEAAVALHSAGLLDDLMKVASVRRLLLLCCAAQRCAVWRCTVRGQGPFQRGRCSAIDAFVRCCIAMLPLRALRPGPAAAAGGA